MTPPTSTTSPWAPAGPVASLVHDAGPVTIVEGSTFCLSGRSGDIVADRPHGLFVLDTRTLSRWELHLGGDPIEPLTVATDTPFEATFVGRVPPGNDEADSELVVFRRRHVGNGMRERITVHNYGDRPRRAVVDLYVDVDFADLFEVKESRVERRGEFRITTGSHVLSFERTADDITKRVDVRVSTPVTIEPNQITWTLDLPPRGRADLCVELTLQVGDRPIEPRFRCDSVDEHAEPSRRHSAWRAAAPVVETDNPVLDRSVARAIEDLGALRIFDPEHPDLPVIAAGAPWFMTLFGRDSLLVSWMTLLVDPSLARGVLETLARLQGRVVDNETEEAPGRILHEVRFEKSATLALGGGSVYYGTADATPLFVMLTAELHRWGIDDETVERLLPHVDRALEWIHVHGDRDGDGYVEYERRHPRGLANQGWKDSWDGISFADGRLPTAPIALCEVQGYVYGAYLARAHLAADAGDSAIERRYLDLAAELKSSFNRDFWLEDRGWFAVGLDADKQPIDSLTSNLGHCLWTGIIDDDKAERVADHLLSADMFTGWGIRTLAASMGRYNPVSYHNGSVWPHDNAICVAGLMRYALVDHAHTLMQALLDASAALGGRLPELFAGIDRSELSVPAAYPTSCVPQAWAAASPLLLLRTMLRLDPSHRLGRVHLAPAPPPSVGRIRLQPIQVGDQRLQIDWTPSTVTVGGLGPLMLVDEPDARRAEEAEIPAIETRGPQM